MSKKKPDPFFFQCTHCKEPQVEFVICVNELYQLMFAWRCNKCRKPNMKFIPFERLRQISQNLGGVPLLPTPQNFTLKDIAWLKLQNILPPKKEE